VLLQAATSSKAPKMLIILVHIEISPY
jgi:hypothetical protein